MLNSHGLFLAILWLLAGGGIFVFARWLGRVLDKFPLEPDTRRLIMIGFVGIVLFGTLNFVWRISHYTPQDTADSVTDSETPAIGTDDADGLMQLHYPDLQAHRQNLKERRAALLNFFKDIQLWAQASPHHITFLQSLINIHWKSQEDLKEADEAVDLSVQELWIHYSTGEGDYVISRFKPEAEILVERIRDAQRFDNTGFKAEQTEVQDLLEQAQRQLAYTDIPADPKDRRKPQAFVAYTPENRKMLVDWLQQRQETTLLNALSQLDDNQHQITTKLQQLQTFMQQTDNRALYEALQKVIASWQDLSRYNQYADYQILFAAEVGLLLEKLSAYHPKHISPNPRTLSLIQQLHDSLLQTAPEIARRAQIRRTEVERSYSPTSFIPPPAKRR
ncbi:hypothetical protein [Thiothrix unzii]|jgi:hypothetical protein|uniref:hypothetical protein n=1 Tax=Thiothrix unzii TaxID=111769 RepID=UPI002A36FE3C|nr:hypothetical protein [Thiothrix unzii]MDX9989899.1 hypothetical protein [Thiothrix unzii]